jgi:predicted CoA-binding protein
MLDTPAAKPPARPATLCDDIPCLRRVLSENRIIAVVGISANWYRPSYFAAKYMLDHGYTIIPVNPNYPEVLGQRCYPDLRSVPQRIDIVDCFRRTADIMPIAEEAIAVKAKVLWQQLGVQNMEAARKAMAAGLEAVVDRCVKIEHARLFGGLGWAGVDTKVISSKRPVV